MAHEMDGKDIRPDAPEEGRPEKHLRPSEGTAQESPENDKDYGFLKDLIRYARLAIQNNSSAIVEAVAGRSVGGSIQHMKALFGFAGVRDISELSAEGKSSSGPYLTTRLFHELIRFLPEPDPDGSHLEPEKPPEGQSEEEAADRFEKDEGSNP